MTNPYEKPKVNNMSENQIPNITINNSSSANASASVGGRWGARRRQSAGVHTLLFLTTAGLGNIFYAWYISSWNRKHGF